MRFTSGLDMVEAGIAVLHARCFFRLMQEGSCLALRLSIFSKAKPCGELCRTSCSTNLWQTQASKKKGRAHRLAFLPMSNDYLRYLCPQGTSSAHHVATLAGLKTCW